LGAAQAPHLPGRRLPLDRLPGAHGDRGPPRRPARRAAHRDRADPGARRRSAGGAARRLRGGGARAQRRERERRRGGGRAAHCAARDRGDAAARRGPVTRVLVSAGDASGDAHAADLVRALAARLPGTRFVGLGGPALEAAGVEIRVPLREVAVGGLVEVLGHVPRVLAAWRTLEAAAREAPTDLAVLVDAPDLNLPLARRLRRAGVPILYYVAPQV